MIQERIVLEAANEEEGLERLRMPQHRAVVRLLVVMDLSAAGDWEMATLLPDMVRLRSLTWRPHEFIRDIALPASLHNLALAPTGIQFLGITLAADPCHLRGLFTTRTIEAPASFRRLRQMLIMLSSMAEARRHQSIVAAATDAELLGIWAPSVQAMTVVLGDDFASTHARLNEFSLSIIGALSAGEDFTPVLRLLPTSIRELHFIGKSGDHAQQIDALSQFVVTLRNAWAGEARATRIAGRLTLLGVTIDACRAGCQVPVLRAELEELCLTRLGPTCEVSFRDE